MFDKYATSFFEFRKKFNKPATHLAVPKHQFKNAITAIDVIPTSTELKTYGVKIFASDRENPVLYHFSNAGILMMEITDAKH